MKLTFLHQLRGTSRFLLALAFSLLIVSESAWASGTTPCEEKLLPLRTLLEPSDLPFQAIPFDRIDPTYVHAAVQAGVKQMHARIQAIRENPAPPTFANTIEALEAAEEPLDQITQVLETLETLQQSPAIHSASAFATPLIIQAHNEAAQTPEIFARIRFLHERRDSLGLTIEQKALLDAFYQSYLQRGALLGPKEQARFVSLQNELWRLGQKYRENVREAEAAFRLVITDPDELQGLYPYTIANAAKKSVEEGRPGTWTFTLEQAIAGNLYFVSEKSSLREKFWHAQKSIATQGDTDNRPIVLAMARLREEQARLLGFQTFADFTLSDRMAGNPGVVRDFLDQMAEKYRPQAQQEEKQLAQFAGRSSLEPWDIPYYSAKMRKELYHFDPFALTPYLSLDRVLAGAFEVAHRLYGLSFRPRADLPVWDPSVRAYEVIDPSGKTIAIYYFDAFRRANRLNDSRNITLQQPGRFGGKYRIAHVINTTSLAPPIGDKPALLTPWDVKNVFHEFGHALHTILSTASSRSLSGTHVAGDFVELPSTFMEKWALHPEVLALYARHYQNGEPIPRELLEALQKDQSFRAGTEGLYRVKLAALDLAWHTDSFRDIFSPDGIEAWERRVLAPYRLAGAGSDGMESVTFSYIFPGAYAAGYYGYLWSDVHAADAFETFEDAGIFDPQSAGRFRDEILSRGGTEPAETLYRRFKGRPAEPCALLRSQGIHCPK